MGKKLLVIASLALVSSSAMAQNAMAKGLGLLGAANSVALAGSPYRYTALSPRTSARHITVVTQTERGSGLVKRWWHLRGKYQLPPISYDGNGGSLSTDGSTLVLSRFSWIYPPRTTGLAILDTHVHLRHPRSPGEGARHAIGHVQLPGSFSVQAISPDGSTIYLIHHLSPYADGAFQIRALDARARKLLSRPITDSSVRDERMRGVPIARATGPDGRWTYTLFGGAGHERGKWGEPFLLALDTVGRRAERVDLPQLRGRRMLLLAMRTERNGRRLSVLTRRASLEGSRPLLFVDTRSFDVIRPSHAKSGLGGPPWLAIAIASLALCAIVWVIGRKRKVAEVDDLEAT